MPDLYDILMGATSQSPPWYPGTLDYSSQIEAPTRLYDVVQGAGPAEATREQVMARAFAPEPTYEPPSEAKVPAWRQVLLAIGDLLRTDAALRMGQPPPPSAFASYREMMGARAERRSRAKFEAEREKRRAEKERAKHELATMEKKRTEMEPMVRRQKLVDAVETMTPGFFSPVSKALYVEHGDLVLDPEEAKVMARIRRIKEGYVEPGDEMLATAIYGREKQQAELETAQKIKVAEAQRKSESEERAKSRDKVSLLLTRELRARLPNVRTRIEEIGNSGRFEMRYEGASEEEVEAKRREVWASLSERDRLEAMEFFPNWLRPVEGDVSDRKFKALFPGVE